MKQIRVIIYIMIVILLCNLLMVSADQSAIIDSVSSTSSKSVTELKNTKADTNEIQRPFSSRNEQLQHLRAKNTIHTTDDLKHETIQSVLNEYGVLGLSKYQYYQVLSEEKPNNIKTDELLIQFNQGNSYFHQDTHEQHFKSFVEKEDYTIGTLNKEYSPEELRTLIGKLI